MHQSGGKLTAWASYCRRMGNGSNHWGQQPIHSSDVRIIDLGAQKDEADPAGRAVEPRFTRRSRILLGAASAVAVAGLLASLPAANDAAPPQGVDAPVKVPAACSVIEQAEQDQAAGPAGSSGTSPKQSIPPGYSIYAAMNSSNYAVGVGLIHPDGLVEMCEDRAGRAELGVVFARAADLGQLPEGVTYAYRMPNGRTAEGLALKVAGVRLQGGTVVENLALPDGRTVPAAPAPATPR